MVLSTSGRAGVVSISGRVRAIEDLRARSYRASLAFCKCGRMQEWHNARPYAGAWWIIARVVDNTRDYRVRVRAASGLAFCKSLAECKAYPSRAWVRRVGASRARGARATCVRDVRVTACVRRASVGACVALPVPRGASGGESAEYHPRSWRSYAA
jgi:hypothetical protein